MVLFLIALIVAAVGVGAYAHYNPDAHDVTLRTYHFAGVPDWMPIAAVAGVVLFLFLLHAIYASFRIRSLRRASEARRTTSSGRTLQSTNR
jgi:hypothetical protein